MVLIDVEFRIAGFRDILKSSDVQPIRLPPYSPNLNAYIERFFRSLKSECLDQMIFFGERSLRNAANEYLGHYHGERNHHGLHNLRVIAPPDRVVDCDANPTRPIQSRERLGGMLRYYYRAA